MLKINDKEYKILSSDIKYINATNNNQKGYSIFVSFDIEYESKVGYISFYVDFFNNNLITNIENKIYKEIPTQLNSKITLIEIYDTNQFIDFIDSFVILKFGKINNHKIKMKLDIKDSLIKLNYYGEMFLR